MSHSSSNPKASLEKEKDISQSQKLSQALIQSYQKDNKDFGDLENVIQQTLDQFRKKFQECETNLEEIEIQWDKIRKFSTNGPGFLNAKMEEIKVKSKNLQQVTTGIKETVSKIQPGKLSLLPTNKVKPLEHLFRTIFATLYHKPQNTFTWQQFNTQILKFQDGQDFISRLVHIHFKDLKPQEYESLLILKNDPEFDNLVVNSEFSHSVIDLADWLEYVCIGYKLSDEKNRAEKQYEKIRKDMHRREGGSLQVSKKFWKQALEEVDKFQLSLMSYQSEIKAFQVLTENSIDQIKQMAQI